jgi:hypothetical protein
MNKQEDRGNVDGLYPAAVAADDDDDYDNS